MTRRFLATTARDCKVLGRDAERNRKAPRIRLTRRVQVRRARHGRRTFEPLKPPPEPTVPREFHLSRNSIVRADQFQEAYVRLGSCGMVATEFGCSTALVSYHRSLLKCLPASFVEWMRGVDHPDALRVLTQRQLRYASRMKDKAAQRRLLASLVQQAQARMEFAQAHQRNGEIE
jgi:hypothetical protein